MQIPGTFIAAIKSVPQSDFILFFRNLRAEKLEQITGAQGAEALQKIQTEVLYIATLQNIFQEMKDRKLSA